MTLVSGTAAGVVGNSSSFGGVFSADGTRVLFGSFGSNLVAGDTNFAQDLFVKDLTTGEVTLVSGTAAGVMGNRSSFGGVFSADGTRVLFISNASNLVAGDTNSTQDLFVKDLTTGEVTLVSGTAAGVVGNSFSFGGVFSADGTRVLFESTSSNLVAGDTDFTQDLFVKDLTTGEVTLVSGTAAGVVGNGSSFGSVFSADGTRVLFGSNASNLVAGDTNFTQDLFVKDLTTGEVTLVSGTAAGVFANGASFGGVFSADGTRVLFGSFGSNLVAGDTNFTQDLFVKDLTTGEVTLVSGTAAGVFANGASFGGVFSADGTRVLFISNASNMVAGDTNGRQDLFVKDLTTGEVARLSTDPRGFAGGADSFRLSGDIVLFGSANSDYVAGDANSRTDQFSVTLGDERQNVLLDSRTVRLEVDALLAGSDSATVAVDWTGDGFADESATIGTADASAEFIRRFAEQADVTVTVRVTDATGNSSESDLRVLAAPDTDRLTVVSGTAAGVVGNSSSFGGVFSPDGTRVLFFE